jgi:tetratricopeptide (TPR) repeat protein
MVQRARRGRIHRVQYFQDLRNARLALGGGLGFRGRFCHTENINLSRPKLLLLAAGFAAFVLSLWGSFHFDDYSVLTGNVFHTLSTRPLTALTFWFSRALGDVNPLDYHAINLALHLAAILLLYDVLRPLIPARAAFIAALIFAIHPIQAETVNYVFARSTSLDTVLCLAALRAWLRGRHWRAAVWFAAALLAKEESVSFPILLLLLTVSISPAAWKVKLKPIAAMLFLALAAGLWVFIEANITPGSQGAAHAGISWHDYLLTQGPVILRYLRLLIIPWGFNVDSDIPIPPVWLGVGAWLLIAALIAVAARRFARVGPGFWFIAGIVLLLPSSSIFAASDLAADRRMYLPMIAFAACVGLLLQHVKPAVAVAIAVLPIGLSIQRTLVWQTEQSLWTDAVEKSPNKVRTKIQLARYSDPPRALDLLEQARKLAPEDPRIPTEAGRICLQTRDYARAYSEFGRALALEPGSAEALNNRGVALRAMGRNDAARQDFERALAIDPCQHDARANLASLGVNRPSPTDCR